MVAGILALYGRAGAFAKAFVKDPFGHWPFTLLSRLVFGNTAGPRQNLYGSIDASRYRWFGRATSGCSLSPSDRKLAHTLRREGVAVFRDWLEPEVVRRVRSRILLAADRHGIQHSNYMTVLEAEIIQDEVPEVFDIFTPRIVAYLEGYFGSSFIVNSIGFRLTKHVPEDLLKLGEVYSDHWHSDSAPSSVLSLFVILNDVTDAEGPTAALSIPATKKIVRRGYRSRRDLRAVLPMIENHPEKTQMIGPAGTIAFVNVARCLHRAGIPASGRQREWLQFRVFPSDRTETNHLSPARVLSCTHGFARAR